MPRAQVRTPSCACIALSVPSIRADLGFVRSFVEGVVPPHYAGCADAGADVNDVYAADLFPGYSSVCIHPPSSSGSASTRSDKKGMEIGARRRAEDSLARCGRSLGRQTHSLSYSYQLSFLRHPQRCRTLMQLPPSCPSCADDVPWSLNGVVITGRARRVL